MANSNNYEFSDDDQDEDVDLTDLSEDVSGDDDELLEDEKSDTVVAEVFTDGLDEDEHMEAIMLLKRADRMVGKYVELVNIVKPSDEESEKDTKDFGTWLKKIKPETITADTDSLDSLIDNGESTPETMQGVIRLLDKLKKDAENTLRSMYSGMRVNSRKTPTESNVDLEAERVKLVKFLNSIEGMAKDEAIPGLTLARIYSAPNVKMKPRKVKNSNETVMNWDIPMAPRNGGVWTGMRKNNASMKLVIDGNVPENHAHFIGDAVRELLGMSIRQYRILAGDVWESNDHIFDWTDSEGVSHKIGQRKVSE